MVSRWCNSVRFWHLMLRTFESDSPWASIQEVHWMPMSMPISFNWLINKKKFKNVYVKKFADGYTSYLAVAVGTPECRCYVLMAYKRQCCQGVKLAKINWWFVIISQLLDLGLGKKLTTSAAQYNSWNFALPVELLYHYEQANLLIGLKVSRLIMFHHNQR